MFAPAVEAVFFFGYGVVGVDFGFVASAFALAVFFGCHGLLLVIFCVIFSRVRSW